MLQRDVEPTTLKESFNSTKIKKQIELERLFNKNQLIPRLRREFSTCKTFDFNQAIQDVGVPLEFGLDLLTQMALHKRTTLPTLIGILKHHFSARPNAAQITADMLLKAAEADMIDWDPFKEQFIVKFTVSAEVQEELNRYQYPLPMVIEPKPATKNTDTGYILGGGSLLLRKNHHNDDICLDHINRLNKVRFAIDQNVVRMVANKWRNLDKAKPGETADEFQRRRKAFEKYDKSSKEVIKILGEDASAFYLTHKYDKRGRSYCQGYHVNYQGAPWNKAVIHLADKELTE